MDQKRAGKLGNRSLIVFLLTMAFMACKNEVKNNLEEEALNEIVYVAPDVFEFGFNLNDYIVKRDTIRYGDSFGLILERNKIGYPKIFHIAEKAKDTFDIRRLQVGKPYTLLCSKDSLEIPKCFIYQPNVEEYVVVNFHDSIHAYTSRKPIKYVERVATGVVTTNISNALVDQGLSVRLAYKMADEIYAWTIDFNRLQKGDRFKVIYTDKYIDDTIYAGIQNVKAAYMEYNKEPFYAFKFETDSVRKFTDFFNEEAKNLRRAFLKAPVQFSRISSRYNLNRRIAYYGFALKPHKGTDFAAAIGTPIMATANGTVIESKYKGGNGNYVKIRHNGTYETQYLHMQKRKVKVGQFVKQGEVIGWVGMTGNTGGPHVCYRFWKNKKQVDPLREKLPEAEPISENLKAKYFEFIKPIKAQLDSIPFPQDNPQETIKEHLISQI
ncbi:MAG: peptidoglycan DD-metalloendopeptidase family protein [Flavobacteriales bacterium]|nr:peptidoglycan DD-metalloendopeptidase family protein [Flavobacteriia bacterium]NCP06426.1 peptidoglycan DD-metalloendopeptidase family protein [Flavobacteriales bacterium]PIV93916.1 MAG: peptidase M23 [Flavobacteriaceae bacterium CG17_big_fil_post_rev_8_21_14_2_50_33_15]PIY13517.1 MAG: peptidase M23 [Flavobacteriaceae bacterium CG_4_10_14_3_um_filter_33_47]PJB18944.1 MAG: peptidase M23 [Flavobacteriaceae bacterium CG_4_9_14_3_um_filter_33_16]